MITFKTLQERLNNQSKQETDRNDEKDKEHKHNKKNALTRVQSDELDRQKKIKDMFNFSNQGELNGDAVKQLANQIEKGDIRYEGFPDWVIQSWMQVDQKGAIPLINNKWFDVLSVVSDGDDDDFDISNRVYGGVVVNHARKEETGVKSINLLRCKDLDIEKMGKILTFERASIEAMKLIDRKNKETQGQVGAAGAQMGATGGSDAGGGSGGTGTGDFDNTGGTNDNATSDGSASAGAGTDVGASALTSTAGNASTSPTGATGVPTDANGVPDLTNTPGAPPMAPPSEEEEEKTK